MTSLFEMPQVDPRSIRHLQTPLVRNNSGRRVELLDFFSLDESGREDEDTPVMVEEAHPQEITYPMSQIRVMIDAARADAMVEARKEFEDEMDERLHGERDRVERLCAEFSRDRQQYFGAAETQVVKLALAVARVVLGRELVNDPLPMKSMAKAALLTIRDGSETVLRVRREEVAEWSAMLADQPVNVIADDHLAGGDVVLETGMGRIELGAEVQLKEIERAFTELMQRQEA